MKPTTKPKSKKPKIKPRLTPAHRETTRPDIADKPNPKKTPSISKKQSSKK
jgi:hypothetical protein